MGEIQTVPETQNQAERLVNNAYKGSVILILALSLAYAVMPIDLIPDFLLGAGQIDDVATLLAGGGSIGLITAIRTLMMAVVKRPRLRQGCLIFFLIGGVLLVIFSALAFFGLYQLLEAL